MYTLESVDCDEVVRRVREISPDDFRLLKEAVETEAGRRACQTVGTRIAESLISLAPLACPSPHGCPSETRACVQFGWFRFQQASITMSDERCVELLRQEVAGVIDKAIADAKQSTPQQTAGTWVDARERKPEKYHRVVMHRRDLRWTMTGQWDGTDWIPDGSSQSIFITDWMPLPEPTSEQGKAGGGA